MGTSINSIPSEVNQYEIEEDDDDFEIVEITRLWWKPTETEDKIFF